MMVNRGPFAFDAPATFKSDSPHENPLKVRQRSEFEITAAPGKTPGAIAQCCGGECHAHADAGGVADLLDALQRQGRQQADRYRACQPDVGAEGAGDYHALDRILLQSRFAQQAIDARAYRRLGELNGAHVILREGHSRGEHDLAMFAIGADCGMTRADPAVPVYQPQLIHRSQGVQNARAAQADRFRVFADDLDLEAAILDADALDRSFGRAHAGSDVSALQRRT